MAYSSETNVLDYSGMTLRVANVDIAGTPSISPTVDDITITGDVDVAGTSLFQDDVDIQGDLAVENVTADTVAIGGNFTLQKYTATVTVANGATTGKEAAIAIPAKFL